MAIVNIDNLKHYGRLNYNVLMIGLHGIGKTAITKKVFTDLYGTRWRYFSAPTLDPWVDFVGVPETVTNPDGKRWLELIRPRFIAENEVDGIFFDELNRSSDKVQNAIMELTQFKTINGHHLSSLKVIWGAINPSDDEDTYKVNAMDPAFLDRFQVHIELPYKIDEEYFHEKYPETAVHFIDWWKDMPKDQQNLVSPRRLDYAADAFKNNCRLEDFLPHTTNIKKLRTALKSQPFQELIRKVGTAADAQTFLKNQNNVTKMLDMVKLKDSAAIEFFEKYGKQLPKEMTEPFVEIVYAQKKGMQSVSNMEELIKNLPDDRGTQATAALINNVDFTSCYSKGGSIEADLRRIYQSDLPKVKKLVNRICDILLGCQVTTLTRLMWGVPGTDVSGDVQGKPTNLHLIAKALSKIDRDLYSSSQRSSINQKLYQPQDRLRGVVNEEQFL